MYDARPIAGRWHLVVVAQNPVSGLLLEQPFTGSIGFDQVVTSAPGLPSSPSTVLPAGEPVTVDDPVKHTGGVPAQGPGANIVVGLDPRLERTITLRAVRLRPQSSRPPVRRLSDAALHRAAEHRSADGIGALDPASAADPVVDASGIRSRAISAGPGGQHDIDGHREREQRLHRTGPVVHRHRGNRAVRRCRGRRRLVARHRQHESARVRPDHDIVHRRPVPDRLRRRHPMASAHRCRSARGRRESST